MNLKEARQKGKLKQFANDTFVMISPLSRSCMSTTITFSKLASMTLS